MPTDDHTTMLSSLVSSLAELYGIENSFEDAHGQTQHVPAESIEKILSAMDVEVVSERQVKELSEKLRAEDWSRGLPPVRVCDLTRGAPQVEITLPRQSRRLSWTLRQENGETARDRVAFEELRLAGRRIIDGETIERRVLSLSPSTPAGYHEFSLDAPRASMSLIVSPGRCYLPPAWVRGRRLWGIAAQLYALRSRGDWGIGDFSDLRHLVAFAQKCGGDLVGMSPYSPLSRFLLNVLNIDVTAVPDFEYSQKARNLLASPAFSQRLEACRGTINVDYEGVTQLKRAVLRELYQTFQVCAEPSRAAAFDVFRRAQPEEFHNACLFQALRDLGCEQYDHAGAPGLREFCRKEAARIDELVWYQWIADEQLAAAKQQGASMAVGLYRDLAVGSDASGAERWSNPAGFAQAHVGAPADSGNPAGQDWGFPAPHPRSMRAQSYRPFIELLRANMRHAGALRIDPAMALRRLFWIPQGATPQEGGYVKYPMEDLIGILALESHRNRCLVIGAELGTVPSGFRERLARAQILSCFDAPTMVQLHDITRETQPLNVPGTCEEYPGCGRRYSVNLEALKTDSLMEPGRHGHQAEMAKK